MSRLDRVNQQLKREISNMLLMGEIKDPRLQFVTITHVHVSADLQHAKVSFSALTDDPKELSNIQEGLNSARGYVRKLIGQRVRMRYTPEVYFVHDKSLEYSNKIDKTIDEIKRQRLSEGSGESEESES